MARGLTYRQAGVDIDAADRFVGRIKRLAKTTHRSEVLSGVGLFAAAAKIPKGYKNPILLTSADGVGTKLLVAQLAGRHDTVGIDLVAMNANDLLTCGAEPFLFLDYLSAGKLASIDADAIVSGIAEGCKRAGMSLVGGETAEMPGLYPDGDYDLAGFAVGISEHKRLIDGSRVRAGDVIVGLESTGLHSNGFSLARRALGIGKAGSRGGRLTTAQRERLEILMEPTRIYVKPVLAALKEKLTIKAMAHITGGGISGNLPRVLPKGAVAVIDRSAMPLPELFREIRDAGKISETEMERTFNCGIGYTIVTTPRDADRLCRFMGLRRTPTRIIGTIANGRRGVRYAR